jgi:hypothetical protein
VCNISGNTAVAFALMLISIMISTTVFDSMPLAEMPER